MIDIKTGPVLSTIATGLTVQRVEEQAAPVAREYEKGGTAMLLLGGAGEASR